jgi:hypothetical protein
MAAAASPPPEPPDDDDAARLSFAVELRDLSWSSFPTLCGGAVPF